MQGFRQISRNQHLPARIAAQYADQINNGLIAPGQRLPTEQAMAQTFGVSRTVIREAIAQLRNEGLVETRQGVGAFVKEQQSRPIRLTDGGDMDRNDFAHLYQVRIPLEIEAAGLAAANRSAAQLRDMDAALHQLQRLTDWNTEGVAADLQFHRILAQATGNAYFGQFIGAISDRVGHVIMAARDRIVLEDIRAVTIREHRAIRDAVQAQDPVGARHAMRLHLTGSAGRVGLRLDLFI